MRKDGNYHMERHLMNPIRSILDPSFQYVSGNATNIRQRFDAVRAAYLEQAHVEALIEHRARALLASPAHVVAMRRRA